MRKLFVTTLCLAVCTAFLIAPAVSAAPCACNKICCIGPHNPGITCETACCTLTGWTTCGEFGTPGCEFKQAKAAEAGPFSSPAWMDAEPALEAQSGSVPEAGDASVTR